jgi:hypothetical protein
MADVDALLIRKFIVASLGGRGVSVWAEHNRDLVALDAAELGLRLLVP